jgi:putative transposase
MDLCVNMLLDWLTADATPKMERVLWVAPVNDRVVLINIIEKDSMPHELVASDLISAEQNGEVRVLQNDPYVIPREESSIPEKHRRCRDRAWGLISPVVELPNGGAFDPNQRFRAILRVCSETGVPQISIYRYLRRFWQRGQTRNALLPDYQNCGAPGKERVPGKIKRGRPHKLTKVDGVERGINIGPEAKRYIKQGMSLFYEDSKAPNTPTLRRAYHSTLERFFSNGFQVKGGVLTPTFAAADELPSFGQVRYWYRKEKNPTDALIAREGVRRFNLRLRAIGGDAAAGAFGPGSVFQIDSTPANLNLVSALDSNRRIGRPALYFIVDSFSRMITGFALTLEEESYVAAMLAVENALTDKVEFCRAHGIEIAPEEWPSHHIPEALVADRGELISKNADHLAHTLGILITNAPAYRADLKPFVERSFRTVQDEVMHHLPGAVNQRRERGDRDERLDAVLTLEDFRRIVIHFILGHNRSRIEGYRAQEFMLNAQLEPRPVDLWSWGITNRAGHLRTMSSQLVRLNLLPRAEATVTERGIRFRRVYYTCDTALKQDWQVKARAERSWKINIAYDPLNTSAVYYVTRQEFEPCRIMQASASFANRSWFEVKDFFAGMAELKDRSGTRELQSRTDRNAQIAAIVQDAVVRSEAVERPESKAEALRDIRENRRVERDRERAAAVSEHPSKVEPPQTESRVESATAPTDGYVSRPSNFAELRAQRQQHQSKS